VASEILRASGLVKTFGDVTALAGVDVQVAAADFLAIVGRSGSGKTTLLHLLAGLDTPDSGRISYQGRELNGADEDSLALWRRNHIGLVFQAYHLIPTLSAIENVALPLYPERLARSERLERARARLEQVGLARRTGHRPGQLSGGEQQRVAIARALVHEPELVLADEPTGNLDTTTGDEVMALFGALRTDQGVALVVATHDDKVAAAADRMVRMVDGRVTG
jgi:putative ABC transport system ATP-binding protein